MTRRSTQNRWNTTDRPRLNKNALTTHTCPNHPNGFTQTATEMRQRAAHRPPGARAGRPAKAVPLGLGCSNHFPNARSPGPTCPSFALAGRPGKAKPTARNPHEQQANPIAQLQSSGSRPG